MAKPTTIISIPTVTQDDLYRFHIKHFSEGASSTITPSSLRLSHQDQENAEEEEDYHDDGLGYYADGVKRRLTDEQIAMFRHSEIQGLLRERRHQTKKDTVWQGKRTVDSSKQGVQKETNPTMAEGEDEDEDEMEYVEFLKRERRDFHQKGATTAPTIGMYEDVALDYDDGGGGHVVLPTTPTPRPNQGDIQAYHHGRKRIVYEEEEGDSNPVITSTTATPPKQREFLWPKIGG